MKFFETELDLEVFAGAGGDGDVDGLFGDGGFGFGVGARGFGGVGVGGAPEEVAGADAVFMPYSVTGYRLAQSILRPHVFEFLDVTAASAIGMEVGIEQIEVLPASPLAGRSLREMQLRRELGVIVLAIRKAAGMMQFNPPADAIVEAHDHLIVMGSSADVRKLEEIVTAGQTT